ncbi:hypothetical protein CLM62_01400 [Streptomyces sp. SA15]|uniref:hypothetical protein n=1 Tax=Streptomyces sp. SA15 TaxID=934019 RepID=UPI000BAF09E1|nr:hypothetical protein [Streptomyces sp. SA15]PAZ17597.1 hypothetical protein CLM62_01400 [Streptomyces sp. SA15]
MTRGRTQVRDARALAPLRQPTVGTADHDGGSAADDGTADHDGGSAADDGTADHDGGLSYARTAARDRESLTQLRAALAPRRLRRTGLQPSPLSTSTPRRVARRFRTPSMRGKNEDPMSTFHPDLKRGRFIPNVSYGRLSSRIVRSVKWRSIDPGPDVTVQEIVVPGPKDAPPVSLRVFQPTGLKTAAPALLWIHGGGLIFGAPEQDDRTNIAFAEGEGRSTCRSRRRVPSSRRRQRRCGGHRPGYHRIVGHPGWE